MKRRRFKHTTSLAERLIEDVAQLKKNLATLAPGPERDLIIKRIPQSETAANIDVRLRSPGLQPPVGTATPRES